MSPRAHRYPTLSARRGLRHALLASMALCALGLASTRSHAGSLVFYESASAPNVVTAITAPASAFPLDFDYKPETAEGGGFYGFSEVTFFATGDLTFGATGFSCGATACLFAPAPFAGGKRVAVTAGDDLFGEFSVHEHLLTATVDGNLGYIAVARGEYIDATGPGGTVGEIQLVDVTILAEVPEPGIGVMLLAGCLGMSLGLRARGRRRAGGR